MIEALATIALSQAGEAVGGLAQTLNDYGPWAVVALETMGIVWLAKYIVRLHEEGREEGKIVTAALVETRDAMRAFKEAFEQQE
jgi:hypothetical protein